MKDNIFIDQDFWRYWNNIELNRLPLNSNLRLFKKGIRPTWEDPKNVQGGKWVPFIFIILIER
jgi:hypothetical protein